jgi:hypothetical protein
MPPVFAEPPLSPAAEIFAPRWHYAFSRRLHTDSQKSAFDISPRRYASLSDAQTFIFGRFSPPPSASFDFRQSFRFRLRFRLSDVSFHIRRFSRSAIALPLDGEFISGASAS